MATETPRRVIDGTLDFAEAMASAEPCEQVTMTLRGQTRDIPYKPGETLLETARGAGFRPAYSCQQGHCGNCMARITSGSVVMKENYVLTESEIADGYALTCQSRPTSKQVVVDYEY